MPGFYLYDGQCTFILHTRTRNEEAFPFSLDFVVWNKASLSDGENKWQGARSIASVSIIYLTASTVNNPGTAIKWAEYFPFW